MAAPGVHGDASHAVRKFAQALEGIIPQDGPDDVADACPRSGPGRQAYTENRLSVCITTSGTSRAAADDFVSAWQRRGAAPQQSAGRRPVGSERPTSARWSALRRISDTPVQTRGDT